MTNWLRLETQPGQPIQIRDATLTPFFQTFHFNIPKLPVFFSWQRPVSVLVTDKKNQEVVLPIRDITRQIIIGILGFSLLIWLKFRAKR